MGGGFVIKATNPLVIAMSDSRNRILKKGALWVAGIIGGLVILLVALVVAVTLWLTPERLTRIVNEEASKAMAADVEARNINYTFWSTFPDLCLEIDSLRIMSRVPATLPDSVKGQLPADAGFLMSSGRIKGGVNVRALLGNKIRLTDVAVDALTLNLLQINDSIGNYSIVSATGSGKIPNISLDRVSLTNAGPVRFTSMVNKADVELDIKKLLIANSADDTYNIDFVANADVKSAERQILRNFPLAITGPLGLKFKPVSVSTQGLNVMLGNIEGRIKTDVGVENPLRINSFDYKLEKFNVNELLALLPADLISGVIPGNLDADVDVQGNVTLTKPFTAGKDIYPSLKAILDIPEGNLNYNGGNGKDLNIQAFSMLADLDFDGDNPLASRLRVPKFDLAGYGTSLKADFGLTSFGKAPVITADVKGDISLEQLAASFKALAPYGLSGKANFVASLAFRLMETSRQMDNLRVDATAGLDGIALTIPGQVNMMKISDGKLTFKNSDKFLSLADIGSFGGDLFDIDADLNGVAMAMSAPGEKIDMKMGKLTLKANAKNLTSSPSGSGNVAVQGAAMAYKSDSLAMNVNGVDADIMLNHLAAPVDVKQFTPPAIWSADVDKTYTKTTPRILSASSVQPIISMLSGYNLKTRIKIRNGELLTYAFPTRNKFSNLDLSASLDSVTVRSLRLRSGGSAMSLKASVRNLRQFLNSTGPAPLLLSVKVDVDTVKINQIAAIYEEGLRLTLGEDGLKQWLAEDTALPEDSVTLLIPRNIVADVDATVKRIEYDDLAFYGIGGKMSVANGDLLIDTLALHSDFLHAYGKGKLTTQDIQNIRVNMGVSVPEVNVDRLFDNFTSILQKAPQLKNLSGYLSANANMGIRIYPAMVADLPTARAELQIHGRDLELYQTDFIRHITRLMMVHTGDTLHFANIDINAGLRDNMMMLYPFFVSIPDYRIEVGGINNFAGEMYYHVGLDKSPLPIPFGVNIKGTFNKPEVRLGGAGWKDSNGLPVASGIMEATYINLPATFRRLNRQFIGTAAASCTDVPPVALP